jgi:hypothetical protein
MHSVIISTDGIPKDMDTNATLSCYLFLFIYSEQLKDRRSLERSGTWSMSTKV